MTLCDAGPLVVLVDKKQAEVRARCVGALASLPGPLITTWPCFVEAMYLCGSRGGWPMQRLLWQFARQRALTFYDLTASDVVRMEELMTKYSDRPMDLADASLVAASEALGTRRLFTLDSDFYIYLCDDKESFEVVP